MANPYDDAVDSWQQGAGRATVPLDANPYDDVVGERVNAQQRHARTVFEKALAVNPDQAAQSKKLMNTTGLPLAVVERNLDEVKRKEQARMLDLVRMSQDSPILARQIMDPAFTNQAHDDVGNLSALEQSLNVARAVPAGAARGLGSLVGGTGTVIDIGARAVGLTAVSRAVRELTGVDLGISFDAANALKVSGSGWKMLADMIGPAPENKNFATDVGEGIGQLIQQVGVQIATGGTASLVSLFAQGADVMDTKVKGDNASQAVKDITVLTGASITALTEKYGVDAILNRVPPAIKNSALRWVADKLVAGGIEATQEITEGILQDVVRKMLTNADTKIGEGVGYEASVAGTSAAIVRAALGVRLRGAVDQRRGQEAEQSAENLQESFKAATASLLRERNPDEFRTLVQAMADGTEGATKEVFIDAEVLNQLSPEVLAQLPGVTEQMADALAANSVVSIPVGDVLTVAPGTPLEKLLVENARIGDPTAMSQLEAVAAGEKAQEFLAAESARVIQQAVDQQAMQESSDRVRQGVLDQLNTVGRFRKEVNEGYATWTAAFYTTMAGRTGLTPEEMAAKYPLRITGKTGTAESVGQSDAMTVEGYHYSMSERRTISTSAYGTGLKGSGRETYLGAADKRLSKRAYFYVDKGTGINPESGVGGVAHRAKLSNVYDSDKDPLKLKGGNALDFESKVLDAGYSGYLARMDGTQSGQVIMLGDQNIAAEVLGPMGKIQAGQRVDALPKREPQWAVQASGEPEMLATKLERMQAMPAWANYDLRVEGRELQVREKAAVFEQREQKKGKVVPTAVDAVANVEAAFELAGGQTFKTNRELKVAIQERVLEALKAAKINLEDFNAGAEDYLVRVALMDAEIALATNPNAVGWYNEKVTKALRVLALVHPEINTDRQAKFAFVWAMAVTSNGLKVDKNFELAERAYSTYKSTGKMPTDLQAGQAQAAINNGLSLYNSMLTKHGFEELERFMTSKETVKTIGAFAGFEIGGENLTTEVYGSSILGPKIGNGFFSNLYGKFEQLTMDRWLMRTWGRWSGTLVEDFREQARTKRVQLRALVQALDKDQKKAFEAIIKRKLNVGEADAVGLAIWKASQKPANRVKMAAVADATDPAGQVRLAEILGPLKKGQKRVSFGDEMRKVGNNLTKYLDGQKEAPSGPKERGQIRKVFNRALTQLQERYPALTMSDLQALLWYPEKRLYDAAKEEGEGQTGYEDDEAPDYANAAAQLARTLGVSDEDINRTIKEVDDELQATQRAGGTGRGDRGVPAGQPDTGARVNFEVAPDPNNVNLTERWRGLSAEQRLAASQRVAERVVPGLLQALGAKATMLPQVGSYLEDTNPSFALKMEEGDPAAVAKALGFALSQDSMMVFGAEEFAGSSQTGAVRIDLSDLPPDQIDGVYQKLRAITVGDSQPVGGQSTSGGVMTVLNFSDVPTEQLAALVDQALGGQYDVSHGEIFAAFPEKQDYDYASATDDPAGEEGLARQRARDARQEAGAALEAELAPGGDTATDGAYRQDGVVQVDLFPGEFADKTTTVETGIKISSKGETLQGGNVNSAGQQITATKQGLQNFWNWFGQSQVVDESGNPLVLYHSTNVDTSTLEPGRKTTNNYGILGDVETSRAGIFLTAESDFSQEYLRSGSGQNVMPVYARLENPLDLTQGLTEAQEAELDAAGVNTRWIHNIQNHWELFDNDDDGKNAFVDALKQLGYDGAIFKETGQDEKAHTTFMVFEGAQIKSALGNQGTFDPANPDVLNQGPRGTFAPANLELALNENADLSTFLHETGHFFLEVMADLSSQPGAPLDIADDMGKLLKWFGVKDLETWNALDLDGKRPYHERFAESFEQYLMEGKAPSLELQPLFRKFRAWLLNVYQSIKAFIDSRVPVTSGGGESLAQAAASGYKGTDAGEAAEWAAAVAKGLDMSTEARMARAKSMGFDTDKTLYHSTLADVKGFSPVGKFMGHTGTSGISVTDSPEMASRYLDRYAEQGWVDGKPNQDFQKNIVPVFIKPGKVLARNEPFPMRPGLGLGAPLPAGYVPTHKTLGYDTLVRDDAISRKGPVKHSDAKNAIKGKEYVLTDPSQLRSVFAAFDPDNMASGNLLAQDPNATGGLNIQLSDEIRQVFDRMLASQEQIAQAEEVAGLLPEEDATAEALEKLTARSLRDLKWTVNARAKAIKALQKQAATLRKDVLAEVTAEVNASPEFQAKDMLDKTRKENKQQLNDTELAIISDAFQYPDVDAMLKAIDAAGSKADVIQGMTDQRMLERHGDLIDQRAIEAAANEAVHNEARARSLATELKSQAEALNPRKDTGQTNAKGSKITVNALVEAAKQFGANIVARTPLRDLKAKAWEHTAAERRAGKRWQEATAKGKTEEAIKAKQDQMLNNAAARAAMDAQAEMRKMLEFFKRVVKDGNEKTVEKGRDPDVVNAARAILGAYGVAPKGAKTALEYLALVEKNDPAMFAALQPSMQGALNMAQPLDALTMDELRGLHEEIQAMWHLAKRSRQMEVDGNMMDLDDAADELQTRMQAIGVPLTMPGDTGAVTKAEERGRWLQFAGSLLRRTEQWAQGMGNEFTRLVFQPVKDAADRYRADRVVYRKKYQALVDQVAPALLKGKIAAPELNYTFGEGHNGIGHAELIHAILHTGNESNKRKLLLGRKWATANPDGTLDTTKWEAFLNRMHNDGTLNKAHYDFAQGVWDLLEETKPLAQKTHRDVFGRYFAEVTADAIDTPFGVYRGGYVPAQADPRIVQDADMRKLAEMENENMSFSFPTTNKGFTKGRVEYNRPLMLDLRTIGQHIDKVLLFSHMEPAVRDVNKLLSRKGVSYSLGRIDPTIYAGMLTPWLKRSATQTVETPVVGDGGISRVAATVRSRAGMALMFANVSNALQQTTGFLTAAAKLKADGLRTHMMRSTAEFISSPKKMAQAVADASPFMANRMENEIAAINDAMDDILLDPSVYERAQTWTRKHAYFLQTAIANTMEPVIWTAGYNAALEKGMAEKDAVRYADSLIRTTQGSTLPEDVSRAETGNAYMRMFNQFIGYFNMIANTNATSLIQISREIGLKKGAGKALGVVTLGMLAPLWVAEAIAQAMRGGPDDEDDDGYLDDWLAAVFGMGTIKGAFAMVPYVGQLANAGLNRFNGNPADDRVSLSPAVSLLESAVGVPVDVYKAITGDVNRRNAVRDIASAVSIATGLPAYAIARPLGYLAGVSDDKITPTGPVDAARGLVTGSASPQSK